MHIQNWWLIGLHIIVYGVATIVFAVPLDWLTATIGLTLIWISVVDSRRFEIPDTASLLLLVLAGLRLWMDDARLAEHVLGAVIWPVMFLLVAKAYRARRGHDGLGFGDVKLMAAIGLLCGFSGTVYVVLAAAVSGLVTLIAVSKLRTRAGTASRDHLSGTALAFAPFLCLGAWMVILIMEASAHIT